MAFPSVEEVLEQNDSSSISSYDVDMPSTVNSGELLLILVATENSSLHNTPSGWTQLAQTGMNANPTPRGIGTIFGKVADGTEGGTSVTITKGDVSSWVSQVYRISGWDGSISNVEANIIDDGIVSDPDPPSLTVSWGADDNLFLAIALTVDDDATVSSAPSGYSDLHSNISGGGTNNGATIGSARKTSTSATEDPGTFTLSEIEAAGPATIGIKPAAGTSESGSISDGAETGDSFTANIGNSVEDGAEAGDSFSVIMSASGSMTEGAEAGDVFVGGKDPPTVTANSVYVRNVDDDIVYYLKNESSEEVGASLAKLMTAYILLREKPTLGDLSETTTIEESDQVSGTGNNLDNGDIISLEALLYNMLIPSSNTSAMAVSRVIGQELLDEEGNPSDDPYDRFVTEMNDVATSLGMSTTTYTDPHGNSTQTTSAEDIALVAEQVHDNEILLDVWKWSSYEVPVNRSGSDITISVNSTVDVLGAAGVYGGKTGTVAVNYNLSIFWESPSGKKIQLVTLVSDSDDDRYSDYETIINQLVIDYPGLATPPNPWTPEYMFTDLGASGCYFDPSDLSTMYQDAAGTTPVTAAGDPVGRIESKAGDTSATLTQSENDKRPILRNSDGHWWLEFDGTDDFLDLGAQSIGDTSLFAEGGTNADEWMVFTRSLLEGGTSPQEGTIIAKASNTGRTFQIYYDNSTNGTPGLYLRSENVRLNEDLNDGTVQGINHFWDGEESGFNRGDVGSEFVDPGAASENSENIIVGARTAGSAFFLAGKISELAIVDVFDRDHFRRGRDYFSGHDVNENSVGAITDEIIEGAEAGDSTSVTLTGSASVSDGAVSSDSFVVAATYAGSLDEGVEAGDSPSTTIIVATSISEGATASDAVSSDIATSITEGSSASDSFSATTDAVASGSITDGSVASDSVSTSLAAVESVTDGAVASDSYTVAISTGFTDGAAASDSASAVKTATPSLTDGSEASDAFSSSVYISGSIAEGSAAGDSTSALVFGADAGSLNEGAVVSDSIDATADMGTSLADGSEAGDAFGSNIVISASITEGASAGDNISVAFIEGGSTSDGTTAGDSFGVSAISTTSTEGASAGDTFSATVVYKVNINEGAMIFDLFDEYQEVDEEAIAQFMEDLSNNRGRSYPGWNSARLIELYGGEILEPTAFEPDPITHRNDYYYNASNNVLYKRVVNRRNENGGITAATWKRVQ